MLDVIEDGGENGAGGEKASGEIEEDDDVAEEEVENIEGTAEEGASGA